MMPDEVDDSEDILQEGETSESEGWDDADEVEDD
jgi:hypothetical protein